MNNKEIVREVVQAYLDADMEKVLSHMTDDVQVGWPGFFDLEPGKDAVRKFFADIPEIVSGSIESLIADGDTVAGTRRVTARHKDGSLKNSFFCDVYELENGKVKRLKSYMVFEQAGVSA